MHFNHHTSPSGPWQTVRSGSGDRLSVVNCSGIDRFLERADGLGAELSAAAVDNKAVALAAVLGYYLRVNVCPRRAHKEGLISIKETKVDDPFTPEDIDKLSAQIDAELRELGAPATGLARGRTPKQALGEKQKRAIEQATGEEATSFLTRFKNAARKDLLREGRHPPYAMVQMEGSREQGHREDLRRHSGWDGPLGSALQIAVVAIAVYVLYLGVEAFCREA
jgi:hypothetical protein